MALPVIPASTPTVVPPVAQKTYDRYWLSNVTIDGTNPNTAVEAVAVLQKARVDQNTGAWELSPNDQPVTLAIGDVLQAAANDPDLANVVGGLLAYLVKLGTARGVL